MANEGEIKEAGDISNDGVDSISLLPDEILQSIISFLPTKIAIRTSTLSKRWRHVWSDTPCLSFDLVSHGAKVDSINKTLDRYTASKMMSFKLCTNNTDHIPYIDRWIEFAMSRNVENMSLRFSYYGKHKYHFPDFFNINNSVKQLSVVLCFYDLTIPSCSVSLTSLKMLSLHFCKLHDECIDKILSSCPILESLTLRCCEKLMVLDLSKSLHLRTLEIDCSNWVPGLTQIVAPHIHFLRLRISQLPCTLVDVSSLKEATLDILYDTYEDLEADVLQVIVLNMLEKLQNVDKLTFTENFLKILSLVEVRCIPFPSFKNKYLTLETVISQYVIPGIVRVLQNSTELRKITIIHRMEYLCTIPDEKIDKYLELQGLNLDQCWSLETRVFENMRNWDNVELNHVASFMELMLKNTKTLEKMVVRFEGYLQDEIFEELLEMVPMLSDKNNVSIVLSSSKWNQRF